MNANVLVAIMSDEKLIEQSKLLGSLLDFTQVFYKLRTGRTFDISVPIGRESHHIIIMRELIKVFYGQTERILINIPPGHSKSEILKHFIAWAMAHYPDCQFMYISYSHELAAEHTHDIRTIMELPHYRYLFGVEISKDSSAKDHFKTTAGGTVKAFGSSGSITGFNAGLPGLDRFAGCCVMDDMHKPDEVHSDTMRNGIIKSYQETIQQRLRGERTPMIFIGQRLHEADLPAFLISSGDGHSWHKIILKAIDDAGNILHPTVMPREKLLILKDKSPYVFSAQYQQDPLPAGGGIFKEDDFVLMDKQPEIIKTFLAIDTAETAKSYNDATVFSFFGIHKILHGGRDTNLFGLYWIDCIELRIEPKDLESEFMQFYAECMMHPIKPSLVAIEKKSTGVTLLSVLKTYQGLQMVDIERTRASGSKTERFLAMQPYVAGRFISLPRYGKHTKICIDHMSKITANNTHRFDDIADTLSDGIKLALIDKVITGRIVNPETDDVVKIMASRFRNLQSIKDKAYARRP